MIKDRIRHLQQRRRAADRAVAKAITANQLVEVKGPEPTETINGLLAKTGILRDHTAPLRASATWSTENLWVKKGFSWKLHSGQRHPSDRKSSHARSIVNLPEIEIPDSNSCMSVVGQGIL